jgi:ubiquinone/menaquinone biosynthesis C-methylase UbiE
MEAGEAERKQFVAGVFGRAAAEYDRVGTPVFAPLGRRLVELAGVQPGDAVLDVATGTGAALFPAAGAAGDRGRVVGTDLSPEMVREAQAEADRRGLATVEATVMDAEQLDFPDESFDRVLCAFSLFFFPDPERALEEFHRVLRPGGTVALSSWRMRDRRWAWWPELLKEFGVEVRQLMTRSFDDPADTEAALAGAGFADTRVTAEDVDMVAASAEEWWAYTWTQGQRAALEAMDDETRERFRQAAFAKVAEIAEPDGIHRAAQALFATASRQAAQSGPA